MDYHRFNEPIRKSYSKVATFFKSKDVVTFLLFLLLASFLWFLHSSSSKREMRADARIKYVGIPAEVVLDKKLPEKIDFMIKDDDKQLWSYLSFSTDTITVDLSQQFAADNNTLEVEYEMYVHKMVSKFSPTAKITELSPNVFSTKYIRLAKKEVDVVLGNRIQIARHLVLTDSISVVPDRITVIGDEKEIQFVDKVYTETINEVIDKSKSIKTGIVLPDGIRSESNVVSVVVATEASTEKHINIPIHAINVPNDKTLRTFPSEAEVTFSVGLSRYNNISANDIELTVDYNDITSASNGVLPINITSKTSGIDKLRVHPKAVEYIIEIHDTP